MSFGENLLPYASIKPLCSCGDGSDPTCGPTSGTSGGNGNSCACAANGGGKSGEGCCKGPEGKGPNGNNGQEIDPFDVEVEPRVVPYYEIQVLGIGGGIGVFRLGPSGCSGKGHRGVQVLGIEVFRLGPRAL